MFAVQADGHEITTVEGLEQGGKLHPLQQAFWDQHGLQCGYCTPGMMMTAYVLLKHNPKPSEARDPRSDRRQSLPLHRVSEHRQGRASKPPTSFPSRRAGKPRGAQ